MKKLREKVKIKKNISYFSLKILHIQKFLNAYMIVKSSTKYFPSEIWKF